MQQRNKWKKTENLRKGQIVLIKNELSHPAKWPMEQMEDIHPVADCKVRIVTIKKKGLVY